MRQCKTLTVTVVLVALWLAGCASVPGGEDGVMPGVPMAELQSGRVANLAAPDDLWDRIRQGFAMPDLVGDEVTRQQEQYLAQPAAIQRVTERSRRYLFHIVEQLELRGMPTELALLPYVESAFNPEAVSSAQAAGLWQFIPSTGTLYNLDQDAWRDERHNIVASTRAALDYLQELHDTFDDWHLALASYNWGPGNVTRAIKRNAEAGLGTAYSDLPMPRETAQYVPRLQALKNIVATPQAYGVALSAIGNHPFFDTVTITQDMDVAVAARLAGISLEDFRALNPAFKRPLILASTTPQILLPWDNAAQFQQRLADAPPESLASWTLWHAPGNTAVKDVANRFNMAEADLRQLNALSRRTRQVKQGATLLVRRDGLPSEPDVTLAMAPAPTPTPAITRTTSSAIVRTAQAAALAAPAPSPSVLTRTVVKAQKDDSITQVAARYDLPADTVASWNRTRENATLKQGKDVIVYLPRESEPAPASNSKTQIGTPSAVARMAAGTSTRPRPAGALPPTARPLPQPAATQTAQAEPAAVAAPVAHDAPAAQAPVAASATSGKVAVQGVAAPAAGATPEAPEKPELHAQNTGKVRAK